MGTLAMPFIGIPIFVFIVLQLMFGNPNNSLVLADFNLLTSTLENASSRNSCEATWAQCSDDNCFLVDPDGVFGSGNGFPCGSAFYILLIIATILVTPFLAIGIPVLLMVPLTEITFFGVIYTLSDFWFAYAPLWGFFGLGIAGAIW